MLLFPSTGPRTFSFYFPLSSTRRVSFDRNRVKQREKTSIGVFWRVSESSIFQAVGPLKSNKGIRFISPSFSSPSRSLLPPSSSLNQPLSFLSSMMGSLVSTGPRACAGARNSKAAAWSAAALSRVADCSGGAGISRRASSRSPSSSPTKPRAASDPPPAVTKVTSSTPTDAPANPTDDDEDLEQYPDRARWVRYFYIL